MKTRTLIMTMVLAAAPWAARAESVVPTAETFASRWTGAWIVTGQPVTSECNGIYTNNQVAGTHVFGRGQQRFEPGVVGRVDQVQVSPSKVTMSITLSERLYVTRPMREFTLVDTAACQVDLKFMVPPGLASEGDLLALESLVAPVVERHAGESQAILASGFLPLENHEQGMAQQREAIAAHRAWQSAEERQAMEARMQAWSAQTARLSSSIENDPDYLAGFARGVEEGRDAAVKSCADLARSAPAPYWPGAPGAALAAKGGRQKAWARGYQDGVRLAQGLEAMRLMPTCGATNAGAATAPAAGAATR